MTSSASTTSINPRSASREQLLARGGHNAKPDVGRVLEQLERRNIVYDVFTARKRD